MFLNGKEEEMAKARKWASDKLLGPGALLNGLQIMGFLQGMESATTEESFEASQRSLFSTKIDDDPFE